MILTATSCGAQKEGTKTAHAFILPYLQQLVQEINIYLLKFITVSFLNINTYKMKKRQIIMFQFNLLISFSALKEFGAFSWSFNVIKHSSLKV